MLTLAQKFSSAMNGIDDEFIEEALTYERSKKRKPSRALRIVLVAALISVLLFTSALAFSPSLRENTLNVLVEIFSDHATFRVEGEEPAGSYIAGKIDYSALEETYRLDPEGCYRVDFASGATFFGNNGEIISITVVAIRDGLVLTLCLSGCSEKNEVQDQTNGADTIPNQSASAEEPSSILYVNHQLGFSMEMPLNWMGQVEVKEEYGLHHQNGGNCITFYHKPTHDNGEGGILFFIDCYPGEWSEDNPPVIAGHSVVVAQTEKDTYLLRTPSDVEYSESDPMLAEAYQSLIAQQDLIISHIYATGQTVIPPNE